MNRDGQKQDTTAPGEVLRWSGRVVTAEDLRQSLNGQRELIVTPRAIITPSASDHLKANGVKVLREEASTQAATEVHNRTVGWGYALERPDSLVGSVVQSLQREGLNFSELSLASCQLPAGAIACGLAREAAQCVVREECWGAVVYCLDPELVCCVANKIKGIRAVCVHSSGQSSRAIKGMGANFLALEIGKGTFFELRQMLRGICGAAGECPEPVAGILKELEGSCQCQPKVHGLPTGGSEDKCQCGGNHAHR
jgi:hypothetical protein